MWSSATQTTYRSTGRLASLKIIAYENLSRKHISAVLLLVPQYS
jgi:hypothetical protein